MGRVDGDWNGHRICTNVPNVMDAAIDLECAAPAYSGRVAAAVLAVVRSAAERTVGAPKARGRSPGTTDGNDNVSLTSVVGYRVFVSISSHLHV